MASSRKIFLPNGNGIIIYDALWDSATERLMVKTDSGCARHVSETYETQTWAAGSLPDCKGALSWVFLPPTFENPDALLPFV